MEKGDYFASWKEMERKLKSMKGFRDEEELREESMDLSSVEKSAAKRGKLLDQTTEEGREGVVKV